ncbi:MAG: ABC-2 family transporter protein [Candidatus Schekmanbacteria bacterium]|nr:ABC-2 family transporter protein [Candidatus Schekmanbacteria bacterium]
MRRYLRLFARTFSISASVMLVYRSNVVLFFVFETLFLAANFVSVSIGFDLAGGAEVAGWSREQVYVLTAINGLSHQVFICFFIGPIFNVGTQVWNGQFDYVLLKPLHPLLSMWFTGQYVVSNLPNLATNLVLLAWLGAAASGGGILDVARLGTFVLFIIASIAVRVALALVCVAPAFVSERLADSEETFWSLSSLGRYPMSVFPQTIELALTFGLPLAMLASMPSSVFFGRESLWAMAGALAAAAAFVVASVKLFMVALGRYQSVSSGL